MAGERWTGPDLRAERARRSRRAADVAQAAGVSRELISAIERKAAPSNRDVARYLRALNRLDVQASPEEIEAIVREITVDNSEKENAYVDP